MPWDGRHGAVRLRPDAWRARGDHPGRDHRAARLTCDRDGGGWMVGDGPVIPKEKPEVVCWDFQGWVQADPGAREPWEELGTATGPDRLAVPLAGRMVGVCAAGPRSRAARPASRTAGSRIRPPRGRGRRVGGTLSACRRSGTCWRRRGNRPERRGDVAPHDGHPIAKEQKKQRSLP